MNHRISLKSVNGCNGCSRFSEVTPKHKPSAIGNRTDTYDCQGVRLCKYQACLKTTYSMSSVCSNASSKTWMPLLDCFVSTVIVRFEVPPTAMFLVDGANCDLCQSSTTILLTVSVHGLFGNSAMSFLAQCPFSCPKS